MDHNEDENGGHPQPTDNGAGKEKRPHRPPGERQNAMYLKREIHFTIEAPSGEQIPMRYKPDMTVETMFNHACKKFNISPEDHYMVFNNKEMELRESMKNFAVNQNTTLKIYKGRKTLSLIPDIFVSVRIRDCRIGSVFKESDNLWDILYKLLSPQSFEPDMVPIVIYMKNEFIGESVLKHVRLRDIGVTQGSCLLRFLQLKQEDLDQRKMKEDEDTMATLESLELKAAGPTADSGLRTVRFKISEDELDTENIQFIGERKALAFRLPDTEVAEELIQEEYFDLMVEEIAVLFGEVTKRMGEPRKSEVLDEVRLELEKLKDIRYDFDDTIVRVQFPDRTCLQLLFLPEERVGDVKDFIKRFLKEPHEDYELSNGSPRKVLDDQSTFTDLKLVPVALFYYQREKEVEQYLSDEVMAMLTPYHLVKEAAMMLRGESLDRFLMTDSDRDSTMRKSTGGFLSKFLRSSHSSTGRTMGSKGGEGGSRAYSKFYAKKQSSFQPRSWSRGSSGTQRRSADDDEDELEMQSQSDKDRNGRHTRRERPISIESPTPRTRSSASENERTKSDLSPP